MISATSTVTFGNLERLALAAHLAGDSWATFWPGVAEHVLYMADGCPVRFERLRDRLLCVLTSGDMDGLEPPGDPWGDPHPGRPGPWKPRSERVPTATSRT